jgi:hypothetical protein
MPAPPWWRAGQHEQGRLFVQDKVACHRLRAGNYRKDISLSPAHLLAALDQVLQARANAEKSDSKN